MIRDCESFKMSTNAADFATYGRFVSTGSCSIFATGTPFGDPAISISSGFGANQINRRNVPGGPFTTLFVSGRMYVTGSESIAAVDVVNQVNQCYVTFAGASGVISVYCGATLLLQTAPGQFPLNAWFWFSIKFVIGTGTSGAVGVQIGPTLKVNLTGVNTQSSARGYCDTTGFIFTSAGGGPAWYLQHLIWNDATGTYNNSYASDQRVVGELPTSAGDTTNFTPVGNSSNYLNAAECPPTGDTDYNYSGTVGNLDLYKGGAPAGITGVAGVMVSAIARKDDSGNRSLSTQLKSGGTVASGVSTPLASSYTTQTDVWETDPSTGVPFTAAALAAGVLQWGVKVAA